MQLESKVNSTYTLLQLKGAFTFADRTTFKDAIDKASQAGCARLIVDLHEVTFLDSAALGVLVLTHKRFAQEQRKFCLLKPTEQALKLLTIAGIQKIITVYLSEQEASIGNAA